MTNGSKKSDPQPSGSDVSADSTEDFYMEKGFVVFTEAFHRKRGYCCNSGCRHCPYPKDGAAPKS